MKHKHTPSQFRRPGFASLLAGLALVVTTIVSGGYFVNLPVSQDFDGLGASATATLPTDFRADKQTAVRAVGTFAAAGTATERVGGANLATNAANGIYNFGSGTTATGGTDRAVGFLSSGTATQSGNLYVKLTNTTGGPLSSLQISYDVEKYRNGFNAAGFSIQMYHSSDGVSWTNAGASFLTSFPADANNNGFATAPGATSNVSQSLSVSIPSGADYYLAWNYSVTSGTTTSNAQALAIDNVSVNAAGANQPIATTCPATLMTDEGTATSGGVSATDPDGTVTSAMISSITPTNPGTIMLGSFTPAGSVGGTATATLTAGATTPAGVYTVTITWSNNDTPTPQTATCNIMVAVNSTTPTLIHDIQGAGETPNFSGQVRIIEGIVVGDFQGASNLNGFFVEEELQRWDSDANTSEGIFVFAPSAIDVSTGDKVRVRGTVVNFPSTPGLTELTSVTNVTVISSGNLLPPAQTVVLPVPTSPAADLEKFEGMLVTMANLVVTDNSDLGQFGELILASNKLFIPTNSIDPNDDPASGNTTSGNTNVAAVTARQSLNDRSRIILNDGKTGSNPNPIPFIGPGTNATIRLGDTVASLTGPLSFGFGSYRVEPSAAVAFTAANPRPPSPDNVGGSLKVASFNIENFFFTLNTGRGADNAAERDRQRDKVAAAVAGLNADVVGLIELEKGTAANPEAAVNELLSKLNTLGVGTYAAIPTPAAVYDPVNPVGTDTDIKSGIIYRTSTVTPVGASLTDTAAAPSAYSRAPITQTFQSNANGAKFTVVVNHLRSKSCAGATGADQDQGDGQSCFNARRRNQAQALVNFINNTLAPIDPDVLLIGDLNAYGQEDPIDGLRAAGLTDQIGQFVPDGNQYSFPFQGQVGRLDHVLTTASFNSQITGATIWHINTDEPEVIDYNTENKPDDRYAPTPFRSADHDPLLLGLNLGCPTITVGPATLPAAFRGSAYNATFTQTGGAGAATFSVSAGALPTGVSLSPTGTLSGTPTVSGGFSFTVRAAAAGGCVGERAYTLTVHSTGASIGDPVGCNGPGGAVSVTATVTNSGAASQASTFTATLAATLLALPGTCSANVGTCTVVSASTVTWAGTLNAGQTVTIGYQAQIADGVATGTQVCISSTATVGGAPGSVTACATVDCQPVGPGSLPRTTSPANDQSAGSVLIYNIYTSSTDSNRQNTRLSITNIEPVRTAFVHLFFVDGATCSVADSFICLTPNQTATFLASDLDPGTSGYLVAVAVDRKGCPVNFNYLIGDEYVKLASGHAANLGAEAVTAIAGGLPSCNENSTTAVLAFDGMSYSVLPHVVALDNIPARADGNDTLLILNRIGGSLATGAATLTSIFGVLYDDAETALSFSFTPGTCQFRSVLSAGFPRTAPRFDSHIPAGRSGWMKLSISGGTAGMTGAVINFNANAGASAGAFNQGHNLHVLTNTNAATYTIPILPPSC